MTCGLDHEVQFQVTALAPSTAKQKLEDAHETHVRSVLESINCGLDHEVPFQVKASPC